MNMIFYKYNVSSSRDIQNDWIQSRQIPSFRVCVSMRVILRGIFLGFFFSLSSLSFPLLTNSCQFVIWCKSFGSCILNNIPSESLFQTLIPMPSARITKLLARILALHDFKYVMNSCTWYQTCKSNESRFKYWLSLAQG